jgi:HPt (histidine-containing phosphotransfer) domain-containing protein
LSGGPGKIRVQVPEELADIAPAYLANRNRDLAVLKDALDRGDFAIVAGLMHKTKGTAAGYGFPELGNLAKSLEIAAKSKNADEARALLDRMREHLSLLEIVA